MAVSTMQDDKKKALNLAIAQIEKSCGKGSIMRLGAGAQRARIDAISTGAINLDAAIGVGGIPRGRVTEVYGPESSGKTTLCLHVVANAQREGGVAAYIDAEHALDTEYARKLGVDVENLLISQPDTGEQALEIMYAEGISHTSLLVDIASEAGIIEKSGAWYSYNAQKIGQGRENTKLYLKDNPAMMAEVEEKVKGVLGISRVAGDGEAAEE